MSILSQPTSPEASGEVDIPECFLVASPEVAALARMAGLEFSGTAVDFPEPLPVSGLLVCVLSTPTRPLPPGWTGVWAHTDPPPDGGWVPLPAAVSTDPEAMKRALWTAETWRRERFRAIEQEEKRTAAFKVVNQIGIALSAERDPLRLFDLILSRSRQLVAADAGSLYLVENRAAAPSQLRFVLAQNDSTEAAWKESLLPLTPNSVAGAVALSGEVVVIDDAYALTADSHLRHDRSFDQRFGYHTCSMVGVPLVTRDGEVLGVLQLINRKPQVGVPLADPTTAAEVLPFSSADVELLRSLASQAAVSLENSRLYEEIQQLFEGFVQASVTAIEQRDPTTSGHSFRVADGTIALARRLERLERGSWAGVRFSVEEVRELRYAALLHDFGKVGVREHVLVKVNKLYDGELDNVQARFRLARMAHRAQRFEGWLQAVLRNPAALQRRLPQFYKQLQDELNEFEAMLQVVLKANRPTVLAEGDFHALETIRERTFLDPDGQQQPLLTEQEVRILSIPRGSLTPEERQVVENHVTYSFRFLSAISWTRDLARVAELAHGHHEKLDGTGYPRGLAGPDIPLGTRMITIADIFDALTAKDRPYKRAVPLDRSLAILEAEAREGKVDADLVQLWIESKAWEDIGTY
ncbi:hypothetical protein NKDENANG_00081 [Candidatus Entotheonellaceae bacterium PAL068K]